MEPLPIVSIIGRPNVGKSSLFNRIVGRRRAVVDEIAGSTRDRNYHDTAWNNVHFTVVDTGGLIPTDKNAIPAEIHKQVDVALDESTVTVFVVEAGTGITDTELIIAKRLRRRRASNIILVVNKCESPKIHDVINEYLSIGCGTPYAISAIHGSGVGDLLDAITETLKTTKHAPKKPARWIEPDVKIAIIGRPNAGKSSIVNKLIGSERMIVDTTPGTTRDAIDTLIAYNGKSIGLVDTAGLRKKTHVKKDVEYYSNLRALETIRHADVCAIIVDVVEGVGEQDLKILDQVLKHHKGAMLVLNKWDIMEKDSKTFDHLVVQLRHQFMELKHIPIISLSAKTGLRSCTLIDTALAIRERMKTKLSKSIVEDAVIGYARVHPHPVVVGKELRVLGARQKDVPFPLFHLFVTNPTVALPSFARYIANQLYGQFDFDGCPIVVEFKSGALRKR